MVYSCSFRNIVLEKVLNVSMLPTEILKVLCWRDKMEVMNVGIIKHTKYPVN